LKALSEAASGKTSLFLLQILGTLLLLSLVFLVLRAKNREPNRVCSFGGEWGQGVNDEILFDSPTNVEFTIVVTSEADLQPCTSFQVPFVGTSSSTFTDSRSNISQITFTGAQSATWTRTECGEDSPPVPSDFRINYFTADGSSAGFWPTDGTISQTIGPGGGRTGFIDKSFFG
jgi:hypothetical protein